MINEIVQKVRDIALKGQMDNSKYGSDLICWQTSGPFLIIYAENLDNYDQYIYRIYKCAHKAYYDRKIIMDSSLENDEFKCIFSYEEGSDHEGRLFSTEGGDWLTEFQKEVSELTEE